MKLLRCWRFVLLFAALIPGCSACAADDTDGLRKIIQTATAAGRKADLSLDIFKRSTRATVLSADEQKVRVRAFDTEMDLRWKDLAADQIAAIAAALASTAADHLALLQFYVARNMKEQASKTGQKVLELDVAQKNEVAALLDRLPKDEPKPLPVAPVSSEPKPEPKQPSGRANHAGRVLPPLPAFKAPVMFNTPEADVILAAMQIFPPNNAWNEDISKRPVHPDSDKMVKNVGADTGLHVDVSENFIIVPPNQPRVEVKITQYAKMADPGPYPMPDNAPVQGWGLGQETLDHAQRVGEGDRHVLVVDPFNMKLYEFYHTYKTDKGWEAAAEATFDLTSNKTRPKNWISADASGLAMFPGIIKYHELASGSVEHAIRMTVSKTRKAFIYPGTHLYAGHTDDPTFPAMGQRFRLKASVDISKLPKMARPIAVALQKYGAIVCDNGRDWDLCATPDSRIEYDQMRAINKMLKGSDMEVIVTTGENELGRQ